MAGLDPPRVLLDTTFVNALRDHDEPLHAEAVAEYADLLDHYVGERVLLVATSDTLAAVTPAVRAALLAPVEELQVAEQYRNASIGVYAPYRDDPEFATLLVVVERERVAAVATFDARFDGIDVAVRPPRAVAEPVLDAR